MIDEIRIKILNALLKDANRSRKQIATDLGVSESYVSKIVKDMSEFDPYIKRFSIHIDYDKAGYSAHAITFLTLKEKESAPDFAKKVSLINGATEVYTVFGEWHIYIRWICRSNSDLMETIDSMLELSSIEKIETITLGHCYKKIYGPEL